MACSTLAASLALAQSDAGDAEMEIVNLQPRAESSLWPTSRMLDSMLRRLAADVGEKYELRPEQRRAVEDRMVKRWSNFFDENRREIEPLLTDYLETRLAMHPPNPDHVADWAVRAMPVYRRLRSNAEAGEQEIRDLLDSEQRAEFDRGEAGREMGLEMFEGQLKRWSVGKFRQNEWWDPPANYDNGDPEENSPLSELAGAMGQREKTSPQPVSNQPPARIAQEMHAWEKYVADFCDRFDLDRSQRNAADSIVHEMIDRAKDHVQTHRMRIAALEERIARGSGDGPSFDRELRELYGPIDSMFRELIERIDKLPTEGQRHRAGMAEQAQEIDVSPSTSP